MATPEIEIDSFLYVSEVDSVDALMGDLFQRKFGHPPPNFPRHFVAFYRSDDGFLHVAGYSHMMEFENLYLSGGSCTDGRVIRQMTEAERDALAAEGGVYRQILLYAFKKLESECAAFYGYSADKRAISVAEDAGFTRTEDERLFVRWNLEHSDDEKAVIHEKVKNLGPF